MNIFQELDRIKSKGVSVTIRWGRSVRFIGPMLYNGRDGRGKHTVNFSRLMKKEDKDFESTIYNAIIDFDEKHPEYL